ncbi:hypothetical protein LTR91_021134 [Friedmanniomyces endolithicus]|uniref:DUF3429 domain-containing protein n=1 Tax=Friedmanniomyces endolithicus TaxID=329885 RepID=A0AAN6HB48_9PEZI|nr:hypothetical protein LTR94_008505 [Friedmanniomyces endolithicus]KAK0808917.1 hypothetical protein LTR38_004393 [Friedmanniomyces endolithicus]KAK0809640.1 hypothetical protein LTR59_002501 [Friedmanniomyces endolithicus]KAK0819479.1 hypothetical protein LTR75_002001 [Friedmanniomyces endolithicus]KAK0844943.1 hypothetical protein LTR03_007793 [Friedmanniomyces endolithicus]
MSLLASRGLLRSLAKSSTTTATAPLLRRSQLRSLVRPVATRHQTLSLTLSKPTLPKTLALARWQSTERKNVNEIDAKREDNLAHEKLEVHPELVSAESSARPIMAETGDGADARGKAAVPVEEDTDMMAGIRGDLQTIRDTFSLEDVPRQAYYVGMAGVLPYLATSLSTVYCAYEINSAHEHGSGLFIDEKTAELALHVIEPIQVGYGAVIISFLGAIHWGLEWAAYGGMHGYPRYMIGIISTGLAWPTLLLPAEYALISQFLIFNFLYYADARACKRGWTPPWYTVYRFVLTFIVGGSIVVSLIGRGHIADKIEAAGSTPADRIRALRDSQGQSREEEEVARRRFLARKDEDEDEEEDEEEGEGEEEEE